MLLVIDVGNTNMVYGVFKDNQLINTWRMTTGDGKTSDEIGITIHSFLSCRGISLSSITGCIIGSVVPTVMYSLTHAIRKYLKIEPLIANCDMDLGITIVRANPRTCGVDRFVDIIAAKELYGVPAIVIDYGTANTFDVVNEKNEFITGFITAGMKTCSELLYQRSAQLPKVELVRPETMMANNTVSSLQAGIVAGRIGETIEIIDTLKRELNLPHAKVVATGGLAKMIDSTGDIFDVYDPNLTLYGLKILYDRNADKEEI
jgi:type III pantothenate kinase